MLFGKKRPKDPITVPAGLVNLHSHILFGVDDGAKTEEQMYDLIRLEYSHGVRHLCFTPHYNPAIFTPNPAQIADSYWLAQKFVRENLPNLSLYLGNEVFMRPDTVDRLKDGSCRPLGDTNVVLAEFHPSTGYQDIRLYAVKLLGEGYTPLFAHIERYDRLEHLDDFYELKDLGVKFQINTRAFLLPRKKLVSKLIERGLIDVIADDRHSRVRGDPPLPECYALVEEKFGGAASEALFIRRPLNILNISQ